MSTPNSFHDLVGCDLGSETVAYVERDAILYALACGARATDLDLVWERDLRVLPGFACTLGLWAVERCGDLGIYDRRRSLHVSQSLRIHQPMPRAGRLQTTARVSGVWDRGKATIIDIEVAGPFFTAGYGIFVPGIGNWGGTAPPPSAGTSTPPLQAVASFQTTESQAALYRLTGDLHPIHIDPAIAQANGFPRPILHGLCTVGIVLRELAGVAKAHPADLQSMSVRLSAPVLPGSRIDVHAATVAGEIVFEAGSAEIAVIKAGTVRFGGAEK